jgi:hypothetical protein
MRLLPKAPMQMISQAEAYTRRSWPGMAALRRGGGVSPPKAGSFGRFSID